MSRVMAPPHWVHHHQSIHQSMNPSDYLYDDDDDESDEPLTLMRSNYGAVNLSNNAASKQMNKQINHSSNRYPSVNQALNDVYPQKYSSTRPSGNQSSASFNNQSNIQFQSSDQTPLLTDDEPLSSIKELDPPNQMANPSNQKSFKERLRLIIYVALAVVVTVANAITWKRTLNRFKSIPFNNQHLDKDDEVISESINQSTKNFEFFVTQLTIFLYVVLASAILFYRWFFTDCISDEQKDAVLCRQPNNQSHDQSNNQSYPDAMDDLSLNQATYQTSTFDQSVNHSIEQATNPLQSLHRKFIMMGLCDSIAGLCSSLGGAFSTGQVQTVINQFNIPLTLLIGKVFLMNEYSRNQFVGAGLIMFGSLICTLHSSSGADTGSTLWFGPIILMVSCVPNSASNIFKEWSFRAQNLDVFLMTTSVSLYQVLLGFVFTPLLAFPAFGGLPLSEVPDNFSQGWACFKGEFIDGFECHLEPYPWVILMVYVFVNFGLNVLLLLITKHGSALLLVISSALSLPFTNLMFTTSFVMGKEAEEWSWLNACGLLVVVVGFLIYSLMTDENGEFMPVQGAAGQMMYVTEAPPVSNAHLRRRRHSFDATRSPLIIADATRRKKEAMDKFHSSRARGSSHFAAKSVDDDRLFFTPP